VLIHAPHNFTCKQHHGDHACLSFVSVFQMAPPQLRQQTSNCNLLLIYRPRWDERLSWPGWLTYSGWLTHISGHPSATGRAQNSKTSPANDRRYTAVPHNQPRVSLVPIEHKVAWGAATLPNTTSPGPTFTSVPSGILIHPAVWTQ